MGFRQWLPLIGLVASVFIFNMSEFVPIGLLTSIATDFSISEMQAGLIISFYAWAVAILSLPMMLFLRKMEYRRMLLLFVALFAFFQFLSGISTNYWMLMVSRIGVAVAHAVFWSIAAPIAVRVVEFRYHKFALSCISTGTSVAMIIGLPLGRVIGLALGWRMTFMTIALVSVAILVMLFAVFPRVDNPGTFTIRRLPDILHNRILMGVYLLIILFVTGYYTGYSYIEPFMAQVVGMSDIWITVVLSIFGVFGIAGSLMFSKVYDKSKYLFLTAAPAGVSVCLLLLQPVSFGIPSVIIVCAVWGMFATMTTISYQNEVIWASPSDATPVAMALFSGLFNVGIAMGSIIGGIVTDSGSINSIGTVGALFTISSVVFTALFLTRWIRARDETAGKN